jgi:hypothetical protein
VVDQRDHGRRGRWVADPGEDLQGEHDDVGVFLPQHHLKVL